MTALMTLSLRHG